MIHAEFFTNREAGSIALRLSGHAGAAEEGKDIVCAASSMLAYTVAQTLQFMHEQGAMKKKPHIRLKEGDTLIVAKPTEESYAETLHTFFVAQVGYHLLSHNYPQYVELKSFGESEGS